MENMDLDSLIGAARREQWETVDEAIPGLCNNGHVVDWASQEGLKDGDGNIRDLAVSLLEKTRVLTGEMKERLFKRMKEDDNPYVRYRSAFAIAAHDTGYHRQEVIETLKQAQQDENVSEFAEDYLKKFEE
jgi:hypothetical protein